MDKQTKSQQIAICAVIIARHYGTTPESLMNNRSHPGSATMDARRVMYYHLHRCGMSFAAIGRLFDRTAANIETNSRVGYIRMMSSDAAMIESLPRVGSSLNITHATA